MLFDDTTGIEEGESRIGQDGVWQQAPFHRGNDIHVVLGENLPANTKTVDRLIYNKGIVESQKSIDLTAKSYASPGRLESRLTDCLHELQIYKGQPKERFGYKLTEEKINKKVLHIGIQADVITPEQILVFEKVGKQIQVYNENLPMGKAPIKLKVTVVS